MKNCLIMGSGRSGTSMICGILHDAGYFMGDNLYPPRHSNPKGFFENAEINGINENILDNYYHRVYPFRNVLKRLFAGRNTIYSPGRGQKWLSSFPACTDIDVSHPGIEERIKKAVSRPPFAYKDPRFSYTLPVWAGYLEAGTVLISIFRDPGVTVESIMQECRSTAYLSNLKIDRKQAYRIWTDMYAHILEKHLETYDRLVFIFLHYEQVYNGSALGRLSDVLGVSLNNEFVDETLKRTKPTPGERIPGKAVKIYNKLCRLAGYKQ